jgi:2-polyprenyl-3-methyl-5-hydroxy-6-metoxy-1,4-benzoquinol methylase
MTTNYDPIAEQYKRSKQQPWRTHIEAFTLMRLIGDPTSKAVVDISCGEGFYTRAIRQRGTAKVTGVNLSEKMIGLARASGRPAGLGWVKEAAGTSEAGRGGADFAVRESRPARAGMARSQIRRAGFLNGEET